LYELRN